jgi:hypothetical protein
MTGHNISRYKVVELNANLSNSDLRAFLAFCDGQEPI